jgi:hypothetical protein
MKLQTTHSVTRPEVSRTAVLSEDGRYRYELRRAWDPLAPTVLWVMLNPSTADDRQDDPTIRRVVGFSRAWGFGTVVVVNLFAYRATDPHALLQADAPVGPANDDTLRLWAPRAAEVIAAWGLVPKRLRWRIPQARAALGRTMTCLGTTKEGDPRHPLYVPTTRLLEAWR